MAINWRAIRVKTLVNGWQDIAIQGPPGRGYDTLAANFVMPAIGATGNATVGQAVPPFAVGQYVYIAGTGWLSVVAIAGNVLTLRNDGSTGNSVAGTTAAIGAMVTGGGPPGPGGLSAYTTLATAMTVPALGATV